MHVDELNKFVIDDNHAKEFRRCSKQIEPKVLFEDVTGTKLSKIEGTGFLILQDTSSDVSVNILIKSHFDEQFLRAISTQLIDLLRQEKWIYAATIAELQQEISYYGPPLSVCDLNNVNVLEIALIEEMRPKGPHVSVMDESTWGTRVVRKLIGLLNDRNNLQSSIEK